MGAASRPGMAPQTALQPNQQINLGNVPIDPMQQASIAQRGALLGTAGEMGYRPQQVQSTFLPEMNLEAYQNPYTSQVIDLAQQDIMRGGQQQMNILGSQAQKSGAFGGSRHGIAMGETNRGLTDQLARTSAGLRQAGFQNAQQTAQADLQRRMQAQQSNQMAGLQGSQQRMAAAQQAGQLGKQSFDIGRTLQTDLSAQGAQQQALQQALIDIARGQYGAYQQYPASSLDIMNRAIGVTPHGQTTTQSATNGGPSTMDYLTSAAQIGASIAAMTGGSDARLKTNIKKIGQLANGLNVYTWDWKPMISKLSGNFSMTKGVMAQEAQRVAPEAVHTADNGYLAVDYSHPEIVAALSY
jgi:O6-methylguanine-DNA--protein-cysteine methyltransferase